MLGRLIDVPIESLPFVDEHSIEVDASQAVTWEALLEVMGRSSSRLSTPIARALGCDQTETSGDLRHPGATIPGFVAARVIPPALLALLGGHRFSRYALVFSIDELDEERARVRAQTRAEFPGAAGRLYRALVIGTRGHVLAVRRLLNAIKRRAEHR